MPDKWLVISQDQDFTSSKCLACRGTFYGHPGNHSRPWSFCPLCGVKWSGECPTDRNRAEMRAELKYRAACSSRDNVESRGQWHVQRKFLWLWPNGADGKWEDTYDRGPLAVGWSLCVAEKLRELRFWSERDHRGEGIDSREEFRSVLRRPGRPDIVVGEKR